MFLATTTASIYRGTTTDAYGDPVDANTPIAVNVRAAIQEMRRTVFDPAEQRWTLVRFYSARMPSDTDIEQGDRILDERSNLFYLVQSVDNATSPVHTPDLRLDLKRID